MAKRPQPRRRPSVPQPGATPAAPRTRPPGSFSAAGAPGSAARMAQGPRPVATAHENLDESYAHVKRDLRRIVVFGVLLMAGIYGSRFLF